MPNDQPRRVLPPAASSLLRERKGPRRRRPTGRRAFRRRQATTGYWVASAVYTLGVAKPAAGRSALQRSSPVRLSKARMSPRAASAPSSTQPVPSAPRHRAASRSDTTARGMGRERGQERHDSLQSTGPVPEGTNPRNFAITGTPPRPQYPDTDTAAATSRLHPHTPALPYFQTPPLTAAAETPPSESGVPNRSCRPTTQRGPWRSRPGRPFCRG